MIEALIKAQTEEERLLEFLRSTFLLIALVGFLFYGMEHWVLDHWTESWQSRIPFYVSLVGAPLTFLMFFHRGPWVRYPFLLWMLASVLTGVLGAYYHLLWNAQDAEVSLWSLSGFLEAFKGSRPVLAALAHTHVGAVAFVVGITIRDGR
ncbi:hypothetical protein Thermus77359_03010 [Thermus oshimai]|jgi:hypothetical protein|uniref:hypothetical protein n=1 Tax=Thermus TaxID=270 RepID=UPI0030A594F0